MKKQTKIILGVIVTLFISFIGFAQSDSTKVVTTDEINSTIQTVILPAVFNVLGATGINLTPFAAIISFLIMFIIRRIEKKNIKAKVVQDITTIVNSQGPKNEVMPLHHIGLLRKLKDKLEGIKEN